MKVLLLAKHGQYIGIPVNRNYLTGNNSPTIFVDTLAMVYECLPNEIVEITDTNRELITLLYG